MTLYQFGRRTKHFCFTLSALLCVLFVAGWARSRWAGDEIRHTALRDSEPARRWGAAHGGGDVVVFHVTTYEIDHSPHPGWLHVAHPPLSISNSLPDRVVGLFGYGIVDYHPTPGDLVMRYRALTLPYWLFTLAFASPFLLMAWRHWRSRAARRIAAGLCPACGYDLRASGTRCPECGAARAAHPAVAAGAA